MKILIVSPFENAASGRGDRNMRLEAELAARGHEVCYLTGDFDHASKSHFPSDSLSPRPGLKVLHLPGYRKNVGLARMWCHLVFALKLWVWAIRTRWDVVLVNAIPPEVFLASTLLRRRALVVDVRDIWPDALLAYRGRSVLRTVFSWYCHLIYAVSLKRISHAIVVAPGFRHWLRRFREPLPSRVRFVPLGFLRDDFRPLSSGGRSYEFCYAGGATPQFDIREFETSLGHARGIVLGSGPLVDDWKKSFPNSEFCGVVARDIAISVMKSAKCLVFPSNPFAQLPNKAFDYFALGLPVVLGQNCTHATRFLLGLRQRNAASGPDTWMDYRVLEKEAITARLANIVESAPR